MWGREMRAGLLFVVAMLLIGGAFREWRRSHESRLEEIVARLQGEEAWEADRAADDSARERAPRAARPAARERASGLRTGGIDPDEADPAALERLPGIGPALAKRIVAEREKGGPFGCAESLLRVPGIGPRILGRIRPYLEFAIPAARDSLSPG